MRRKITVIGPLDCVAGHREHAEEISVLDGVLPADAAGSDVVVFAPEAEPGQIGAVCEQVARRAPAAVMIVAAEPLDERCAEVLQKTNFPRGRVLGTREPPAVIDAVLADAGEGVPVVVRHHGENGREGFYECRARVGAGGAQAIEAD